MTTIDDTIESIRERIAAGETVTPAALTKAKAAVELREIVASVEQDQYEAELEAQRVARIDEILADVEAGSPDELGAILVAYDALEAASEAMSTAVDLYGSQLEAKVRELESLKPLPEGVLARTLGVTHELHTPNGIQWPQPDPMFPQLVAEAALPHVADHKRFLFHQARGRIDMSVLGPIRKAIEHGQSKKVNTTNVAASAQSALDPAPPTSQKSEQEDAAHGEQVTVPMASTEE